MNNQEISKKVARRKKTILFVIILIAICGIATVILHNLGYLHYPWDKTNLIVSNGKKGTLPNLSEEEVMDMMQKEADESKVRIQMNTKPVRQEDGRFSYMIQNLETNKFEMEVKIYLGDDSTGELVFDSGKLQPGYYVDYDKSFIQLESGTHTAIGYVLFYEGDETLTTATIDMQLVVN